MSQARAAGALEAARTPPTLVGLRTPSSVAQCSDARAAVAPEHPHLRALRAQSCQRGTHRLALRSSEEIGEEHVAAEALAPWPRLDLRQVDPAIGELAQAAHEPARVAGA